MAVESLGFPRPFGPLSFALLGPFKNDFILFPPDFLLHQIQVDQGIAFRFLHDFSRALDKRKYKMLTFDKFNFIRF